jgi:hypothetical protein
VPERLTVMIDGLHHEASAVLTEASCCQPMTEHVDFVPALPVEGAVARMGRRQKQRRHARRRGLDRELPPYECGRFPRRSCNRSRGGYSGAFDRRPKVFSFPVWPGLPMMKVDPIGTNIEARHGSADFPA